MYSQPATGFLSNVKGQYLAVNDEKRLYLVDSSFNAAEWTIKAHHVCATVGSVILCLDIWDAQKPTLVLYPYSEKSRNQHWQVSCVKGKMYFQHQYTKNSSLGRLLGNAYEPLFWTDSESMKKIQFEELRAEFLNKPFEGIVNTSGDYLEIQFPQLNQNKLVNLANLYLDLKNIPWNVNKPRAWTAYDSMPHVTLSSEFKYLKGKKVSVIFDHVYHFSSENSRWVSLGAKLPKGLKCEYECHMSIGQQVKIITGGNLIELSKHKPIYINLFSLLDADSVINLCKVNQEAAKKCQNLDFVLAVLKSIDGEDLAFHQKRLEGIAAPEQYSYYLAWIKEKLENFRENPSAIYEPVDSRHTKYGPRPDLDYGFWLNRKLGKPSEFF